MLVRTLQGDYDDLVSGDDLYLMIGIKGEVSPITRQILEKIILYLKNLDLETEYFPSIRNKISGESINLNTVARKCISKGEACLRSLLQGYKGVHHGTRIHICFKASDYLVARKELS